MVANYTFKDMPVAGIFLKKALIIDETLYGESKEIRKWNLQNCHFKRCLNTKTEFLLE